ncbi:MAG: hypothetical protein IT260_24360 [Saprospiraceae bacterium]|nr:hypothetical protein [Saprospiraceae bacterium]
MLVKRKIIDSQTYPAQPAKPITIYCGFLPEKDKIFNPKNGSGHFSAGGFFRKTGFGHPCLVKMPGKRPVTFLKRIPGKPAGKWRQP